MVTVAVVSTAHPHGDGRMTRWAEELSALGHDVTVTALGSARPATGWSTTPLAPTGRAGRVIRALRLATQTRADIIVAIDPELWLPMLALQRPRGTVLIADVHEDFSALGDDHDRWGPPAVRALLRRATRALVLAASAFDMTVVADHHVPPHHGRHRIVGQNVPEPMAGVGSTTATPPFTAVYVGDLTPQRGLQSMIDGVIAAPDWELDLYGPERAWATESLADARTRSDGRVRWRGHVPQAQLPELLSSAHVGLCLLDPIPSYAAAYPSKVHEYHCAGLAVVSTDLPRVSADINRYGSGVVLGGATPIAAQLTATLARWAHAPDALDECRAGARRAAAAIDRSQGLRAAIRQLPLQG